MLVDLDTKHSQSTHRSECAVSRATTQRLRADFISRRRRIRSSVVCHCEIANNVAALAAFCLDRLYLHNLTLAVALDASACAAITHACHCGYSSARHKLTGMLVAIKRIQGVFQDTREAARTVREVQLLRHFKGSEHV
jgi:hypothetical protein